MLFTLGQCEFSFTKTQMTEEEGEATYQKMLFTLGQCEFSFTKTQMILEMNKREMERYEQVYSEIERSIAEAEQQITQYREELQQSREIRKHRQEYDALAQVIQQHPPRQESEEKIAQLKEKLQTLLTTRDALSSKLELRRKQFHLLMHSIHQLQDMMGSESQGADHESQDMDMS